MVENRKVGKSRDLTSTVTWQYTQFHFTQCQFTLRHFTQHSISPNAILPNSILPNAISPISTYPMLFDLYPISIIRLQISNRY